MLTQPHVHGVLEAGIVRDQELRFAARFFEKVAVALEVSDQERGQAVLLRAEEVSRATQLEVQFRELEAVG